MQLDPNLPVVILSQTAGEKEWAEALDAGAFDLVGFPYFEGALLPVVTHAVASYDARIQHSTGTLQ